MDNIDSVLASIERLAAGGRANQWYLVSEQIALIQSTVQTALDMAAEGKEVQAERVMDLILHFADSDVTVVG